MRKGKTMGNNDRITRVTRKHQGLKKKVEGQEKEKKITGEKKGEKRENVAPKMVREKSFSGTKGRRKKKPSQEMNERSGTQQEEKK